MPIGVYKHKRNYYLSPKHKKNIGKSTSVSSIGNKNACGSRSDKFKKEIKKIMSEKYSGLNGDKIKDKIRRKLTGRKIGPHSKKTRNKIRRKLKDAWKNPSESLLSTLGNNCGRRCYSDDGLFFLSNQEMLCYYWLRDVLKVRVKKFGRFDFIINDEVVLEYHPIPNCFEKRSFEQYYKERRKLLNELDHKDLKLVVMTNLKEEEKERIKHSIEVKK